MQQGLQQGLQREVALVLRQLEHCLGPLSPELRAQLQQLSISQLENLGEALLDFSSTQDLLNWLKTEVPDFKA